MIRLITRWQLSCFVTALAHAVHYGTTKYNTNLMVPEARFIGSVNKIVKDIK